MIYLDHNATTPLHPVAREAMWAWAGPPANPMAAHRFGRTAARALDVARGQVAELCGWRREDVVFTGSATEANATVLSVGRWLGTAVEHPSVRAWCVGEIPVDADGVIRLDAIGPEMLEGVTGLSVMAANNETGVCQPLEEVRRFCRARGLWLHVDAAQLPGRLPARIDADAVTINAHKMGGPAGVGALLLGAGLPFAPLLRGGPQEHERRPGTHNVMGIVGMGAAATVAGTMRPDLRDRLESAAVAAGGRVVGAGAPRLPNTSAVVFPGVDAQDVVIALDLAGVAVSAGSACASGSARASHVLRAMGIPQNAVRFSLGPQTTEAEIDTVAAQLVGIIAQLAGPQ